MTRRINANTSNTTHLVSVVNNLRLLRDGQARAAANVNAVEETGLEVPGSQSKLCAKLLPVDKNQHRSKDSDGVEAAYQAIYERQDAEKR